MLTRQKSVNSILQSGMTVLAQSSVTAFSFLQSISDQRAGKQTIMTFEAAPITLRGPLCYLLQLHKNTVSTKSTGKKGGFGEN